MKVRHCVPLGRARSQTHDFVPAAGIQNISVPCEHSNFRIGRDSPKFHARSRSPRELALSHAVWFQVSSLRATKGPMASTSILVLWKQSIASFGVQTIGSFSLKLVLRITGTPVFL